MTQKEFAQELGCSQGAVSHYETGRRAIDVETASKLIDVAGKAGKNVTYNDIFGEKPTGSA